jgi:hypothetical protein
MTSRTNARIAGAAFLFYILVGIASGVLFSRGTRGEGIAARLASVPQHLLEIRLSLVFTLLSALSALVLAVTLYGITRDEDNELAMFGLTCRAGEGVLGMFPVTSLGMIWLGTVSGASAPDAASVNALGAFLLKFGAWKSMTCAILFALGSTAFAWQFLRGRMIPLWMARLGVAASALLVVGLPLQLAGWVGGTIVLIVLWLPMLVFELALAVWLIAKGAAQPAIQRA